MAPSIKINWNLSEPSPEVQQYDLQLMTICGVSVLGRWCGQMGEFFVGWAPLLDATASQLTQYQTTIPDFERYVQPERPTYVN